MKTCIAALAIEINKATPGVIQLFPAGEFRAMDGRPDDVANWVMTAEIAAVLIAQADARQTPYMLDYEHQIQHAKKNGLPVPAAGWFKRLEWREGEGLYAIDVAWTARAAEMIAADEYRYISPLFAYSKPDGYVQLLINAALTNTPALDDMDEVILAAASLLGATNEPPTEDSDVMDELLEQLRWMLNLPLSATQEDVIAELNKLRDKLSGGDTAAASVDLLQILTTHETQLAALSAKADSPDPAKWVSVDVMNNAIQQAVERAGTTNEAALAIQQAEGLVTVALSDGRLLPAQEAWAKSLAKSDPASLTAFIGKAPKIAALSAIQTGGKPPAGVNDREPENGDDTLNLAICSLMGTDPDEISAFYKGEK
ncbi:phage protease [Citrobacter portucalensis]|uniref:phage protease n=1 Tax=Citrobacter portucalensis TaxID=1639133 RepID=UPI00226B5FD5|nr:phage protease [Citrobacter portucalensis]MCX9038771.1 phage protease [Citrobacter portucalensis]